MKLHLGCGTNPIPGWLNIDLDSPMADRHADLRQPLPFLDATVERIFSEHFIEHITRDEGAALFKECRRVLQPGGVLRLSTPDLRWLVAQYIAGRLDGWRDVGWTPDTPCRLMNEGMRLWEHQFLYDREELTAALRSAGFDRVQDRRHHESPHPDLVGLECRPWHRELIMEAS